MRDSTAQPAADSIRSGAGLAIIECMRPHQWIKNAFVLAPLLFSGKLSDSAALPLAALAAVCFCLLSSAMYLVNDVLDAAADRLHPEKRTRPVASGSLGRGTASVVAAVLVLASLAIGAFIGPQFLGVAAAYGAMTLAYSWALKRIVILDAMTIAAGFVLRVVGGAVAIDVVASHWLVMCAFLLALFLAFAKRRQELGLLEGEAARHRPTLAGYSAKFLEQTNGVLCAAAIVCYALYTLSAETIDRFGTDKLVYGTAFVIYGFLRYSLLTSARGHGGDPSKTLIVDKPLLLSGIGWVSFNAAVIYRSSLESLWSAIVSR